MPTTINTFIHIVDPATGARVTSLIYGIRNITKEDALARAESEYPGMEFHDGDNDTLNKFTTENKLFKDGVFVDAPKPTDEEIRQQKIASLNGERISYENALNEKLKVAELQGDADTIASIRAEYSEMITAYTNALKEV